MRGRQGSMLGRRDMHGRQQIAVAIIRRMGERAQKARLLFYIYSCLYHQLVRLRVRGERKRERECVCVCVCGDQWEILGELSCGVVSVRAEKLFLSSILLRLVIELFIVALILVDCFMSLFHHYHMYSAIAILSAVIPSSLQDFILCFLHFPPL